MPRTTASDIHYILIIYATNSGNTYFVAETIGELLKKKGYRIRLQAVADTAFEDFKAHDLVILGSCTWNRRIETARIEEGQLQDQMDAFVRSIPDQAGRGMRFAVFGLGDKDYQYFCRAADHLERFIERIGGVRFWSTLRVSGFPQEQRELIGAWVETLAKKIQQRAD